MSYEYINDINYLIIELDRYGIRYKRIKNSFVVPGYTLHYRDGGFAINDEKIVYKFPRETRYFIRYTEAYRNVSGYNDKFKLLKRVSDSYEIYCYLFQMGMIKDIRLYISEMLI